MSDIDYCDYAHLKDGDIAKLVAKMRATSSNEDCEGDGQSTKQGSEKKPVDENGSDSLRVRPRGGVYEPFPLKLHRMLEDAEKLDVSKVVSWNCHGRAFTVHDPKIFVKVVLPMYFRQTKLTSFQRQLNLYNFRRFSKGDDIGSYFHEFFLRGKPSLSHAMVRNKRRSPLNGSSINNHPDFRLYPPMRNTNQSPTHENVPIVDEAGEQGRDQDYFHSPYQSNQQGPSMVGHQHNRVDQQSYDHPMNGLGEYYSHHGPQDPRMQRDIYNSQLPPSQKRGPPWPPYNPSKQPQLNQLPVTNNHNMNYMPNHRSFHHPGYGVEPPGIPGYLYPPYALNHLNQHIYPPRQDSHPHHYTKYQSEVQAMIGNSISNGSDQGHNSFHSPIHSPYPYPMGGREGQINLKQIPGVNSSMHPRIHPNQHYDSYSTASSITHGGSQDHSPGENKRIGKEEEASKPDHFPIKKQRSNDIMSIEEQGEMQSSDFDPLMRPESTVPLSEDSDLKSMLTDFLKTSS
jgi:hypothetical protein